MRYLFFISTIRNHRKTYVPRVGYFQWFSSYILKKIKDGVSVFSLTNKDDSTVLCFVVKHEGGGKAQKKCRGRENARRTWVIFPAS